jgi:hypothetical protein
MVEPPRRAPAAALAWVLVVAPQGVGQSPSADPAPRAGFDRVDLEVAPLELEAHVAELASDAFGGRDTASPGELAAASYLAERLADAGWLPAGDEGYLQLVPLERGEHSATPTVVGHGHDGSEREYAFGLDFSVYSWAELDGRLRLTVAQDTRALPEAADGALFLPATISEWRELERQLSERGSDAPALAILRGPASAGRVTDRLPGSRLGRAGAKRMPVLRARGELRRALEAGELAELEVDLGFRLVRLVGHNVVARLDGVGSPNAPQLAEETIVLSAHLDHLGTRAAGPGAEPGEDLIFNGADDDASGCAALVEVAEALALGPPPARDCLCLFVTGEERGLLGSLEYLDRPAAPLETTVYNLNVEMLGRPDALAGGTGEVWLTGPDKTTLAAEMAALGVELVADPRPDQHFYERSDNIVFVQRGIPGQTLSSFGLHADYHTPADEWTRLDYEHMAAATRQVLVVARALAEGRVSPTFTSSDD